MNTPTGDNKTKQMYPSVIMLGGKGGLTNVTILQQAQEYQRMLIKLSPYLCNFFFYADVCLGALCSFEGNEGTQLQTQTIYQEMFSKKLIKPKTLN